MRKLTLLITMLFLSLGIAWAQTEAPTPVLELSAKQIGTRYPKQLDEADADKIYALQDLTIAVRVITEGTSGRRGLFVTSDPTLEKNTDAEGKKSRYVAYGLFDQKLSYLASWRDGDRFTGNSQTFNANQEMTCVYVINPTDGKFQLYLGGNLAGEWKGNLNGFTDKYEIATPKMVKTAHTSANIYLGGGMSSAGAGETFGGRILGVKVYSGALTDKQIQAIEFSKEYVADASAFENGTIYTFVTERGWMGAKDDNDNVISTVYTSNGVTGSATNANFQWTVYKSENSNNYYLYNIGKGQFMGVESGNNTAVPFVEIPAGNITFKQSSSNDYPIMFSTDNAAVVNHSGNHASGLISWTGGWTKLDDDGSNHKVELVGEVDATTIAGIAELVNVYELLPTLDAAIANAESMATWVGTEVGKYSYNGDYADELEAVKTFRNEINKNTTVKDVEDKIQALNTMVSSLSLNFPVIGKYYTFSNNGKYITSNVVSGRIACDADDAYAVYYFDGSHLKSIVTGQYIGLNKDDWTFSDRSGSVIQFEAAANGALGKFNINSGNRWLHLSSNNDGTAFVNRCQYNTCDDAHNWVIEEVIDIPETVAAGYYTISCDGKYVSDDRLSGDATQRTLTTDITGKNIFYYDGQALIGNASGCGFKYAVCNTGHKGAGNHFEFFYSITEKGKCLVKSSAGKVEDDDFADGYYWKANDGNYLERVGFNGASLWTLTPVTMAAQIGEKKYYTLAEAVEAWQSGQTINLLANTDEDIILPAGVSLEKNGFTADNVKTTVEVSTKADLDKAIATKAGDVIKLTSNLKYDNSRINIDKAIILDLNGKTIETNGSYGVIKADGGCSIINGNIVYTGTNAAIKVWNANLIKDIEIEANNTSGATIGGIVIQEGSAVRVDSIKNVKIYGDGLTNGIQTYNCGTAKENVIGYMENVNIDARGVAMNIYAPCGTAKDCTFKGDNYGIELWIKGTYNASLNLVNCTVVDSEHKDHKVFIHDEFKVGVTNDGTLKLTADAATGLTEGDIEKNVMHNSNYDVKVSESQGDAQAQTFRLFYRNYVEPSDYVAMVGETGFATLEDAFAAAQNGKDVELIAATYEGIVIPAEFTGKLVINGNVVVENANGSAITGENINISGTGTLTAIANGDHAYGIGGDNTKSINIEKVHILKVQGGHYGEIGTDTKYYKDAPEGGAAIGSGNNGAIINLTNVTIDEALGGSKAAGIGARYHTGVTINITGCTINKVEGGATAAGIGGSRVSSGATESEAVTINIQNSTITEAVGGVYAAGIGSGYDTYCQANQPICTINIDGSTINAQGGQYAAGIGTGYHNAGLAGEIKNSTITAASGDKVYKDSYTSAQDIGFGVADLGREGSNNDSSITYDGTKIALPRKVAKVGDTEYFTFSEALEAASAMTGDVTVEILDKVTLNQPLTGSYSSIKFVGKSAAAARSAEPTAEIYLDVQGYVKADGKKVAFENLKLSKVAGGYTYDAGFMNLAFGVYGVTEATYTNCTFANGAYASTGNVIFTGCTFYRSHDRYGLWVYGDVNATVDGCTFADIRGIKMYDEGKAGVAALTVKNTDFTAADNKPAIVLTYGESVTLENNTYNTTQGVFELDLDGKPNGVAVTSDVLPTCVNDNGACGVLVDGKIYTTVAQAAEVATSGSTVTLLHESAETVVFPMGTTLNKGGFTADNVTVAAPVAKIGETTYATLAAAFAAVTSDDQEVIILQDVTENLAGAYLRGNITTENGVKVTINLTNEDWVYCPYTFVLGENITLNVPALFYYAGGSVINGTVVADAYYQRYAGTKLTINEPGSLTVTSEMCYLRYMDGDANAGIYINGDNNNETVGLKLSVAYFYQGMINAKDANIVAGTYWQTNETDGQGSANLILDNSTLTVTVYDHPAKATGNSTVTLKNGATMTCAGGLQVGADASFNVESSTLAVNGVTTPNKKLFISGNSVVKIENLNGRATVLDETVLTDSYIKSQTNGTTRVLGDLTLNGGFSAAYFMTAGSATSTSGYEGTITIEGEKVLKASYGIELNGNVTLNGGTLELSGGNKDGGLWGCVFQSGEFTINTDVVVTGNTGAYAPIYFTDATATINSSITQTNSGGEPLYIGKNSVVTLGKDALINALSVHGAGKLIIDAEGMNAGEYANVKCGASGFTGTLEVINNDKLEAKIENGKIVLVEKAVAMIGAVKYASLQAAIYAATEGQTVTIVSDIALTEGVTVAAGKVVTLDLNGKTVSMKTAEAAVAALIKNNGTLTIVSTVDGGKLSFLATAPSAANAYASNTISNYGTLTINAGTVENLSAGGACYALDNYAGSTATINGGKLTAEKTAVRVFNWTNGEANAAELNVVGGEIISNDGYGININAGNAPYVALNISGGTITTNDTDYNLAVYVVNKNSAENFTANIEGGIFNGNLALNGVTSTTMVKGNVSVSGGTFDGVICYGEPACQFITGGSYMTEFTEDYLVYGYQLEANTETALYDANWTGYREALTIVDGEVTEFVNANELTVGTLTYKRTGFPVNTWVSLYVPFEVPVSKLTELGYDVAYPNDIHFKGAEDDGVVDEIWAEYIKINAGVLKANFPYMIRANNQEATTMELVLEETTLYSTDSEQTVIECSSAFYKFNFAGTYKAVNRTDIGYKENVTSCFAVANSGNWAEFTKDTHTLNPFRVYMTMTAKAGAPYIIPDEVMKSIGARVVGEENEDGTTVIYDVNAENGEDVIYDLNGRRVLETEKGGLYIINGKKVLVK